MRHISEKEKCLKIFKKLLTNKDISCIVLLVAEVSDIIRNARVAQLVERDLAKVEAAGSSPVSRFCFAQKGASDGCLFFVQKEPCRAKKMYSLDGKGFVTYPIDIVGIWC